MSDSGHIKIHRKMLDWEWYKDTNTFVFFIHCLLVANWKEGRFMGHVIPRGSFVSSYSELAQQTNLSVQNVRTAISHLKSTGELTSKSHAKFTIFTVVNYNKYQDDNRQTNKQLTNNQQTTNKQLTTIEESNKERNKEDKNINIYIHKNIYSSNFELFWNEYPRKQDKGQAYKCYQARLRDGYTEDQLLIACKNYAAECKKEKREKKYIKVASTFLSVNEPFVEYLNLKTEGGGNSSNGNDILGGGITEDQREREEREERERYQRYFESDAFKHADDNLPFM